MAPVHQVKTPARASIMRHMSSKSVLPIIKPTIIRLSGLRNTSVSTAVRMMDAGRGGHVYRGGISTCQS